jgi:hypothetical protein
LSRTRGRALAAAGLAALFVCAAARARGPEVDYMLECRGCHGADGAGSPEAVPDLRDSIGRFLTVPGGRSYLVRVPGSAQSGLDDPALAALLNWMIRRFGPAEVARGFRPYSGAEVGALRRTPLVDVETVRAGLLRALGGAAPQP